MSSESLLPQPSIESTGRNMEARSEHQKNKMYSSIYTFTTALGGALHPAVFEDESCLNSLGVVAYVLLHMPGVGLLIMILFWILRYRGGFAWQSQPNYQFYWHPFLMVLSMVFLYSQSILIYRTGRVIQKRKLKLLHATIHCSAFILAVIGLKAVFDSHNLVNPPIPNLYTLHSWLGLITVIIFAGQFLFGFTAFLYPGIAMSLRKATMPIHVVVGTSGFVLAIVTVVTGLTEKVLWTLGAAYGTFEAEGFVFNFIGLITVLYGLLVLYLVNETMFKRQPLPDEDIALSTTH